MRRLVGVIVLGIVIAAIAAPVIPLAIVTLELADLPSRLCASERRLVASDLDPCDLVRSWLTRIFFSVKSGQAIAVLLIC